MLKISELVQLAETLTTDAVMRYDAYQLLADRIGIARQTLKLHMKKPVPEDVATQFKQGLDELLHGKPLHRILGYRYFWKDKFRISTDTLEPRPDTETLIEVCLKHVPNLKGSYQILDLGTGSGCILLSLLREYVSAVGYGVDISKDALETAGYNADQLGLADRASWIQSDWLSNVEGKFNIIISNPPYIPSLNIKSLTASVQLYDPWRALDGGGDGLEVYRQLVNQLPMIMYDDTIIILEIGYDQGDMVPRLFADSGYKVIDIVKDYGGNYRCVVLRR
jgi:release factor glutamine methyltransferase